MSFSVAGKGNCAVIAGVPYVYVTVRGAGFVMRAQCPHRGGPLHLATLTADAARLVCPWHGGKSSVARLHGEIPAVRAGNRVTAVFGDTPERGDASLEYRPLSPDLVRRDQSSPGGATPRTPRGASDAAPSRGTPPDPRARISDTQAARTAERELAAGG